MSIYTLLFGYEEPQMGHFSEGPPIQPRPAGSPLTTHKIELAANHQTDITLMLSNSHSPESRYRPLYYAPCTVDGEVTLDVKKAEEIKALYVSIEGRDLKYGNAGPDFSVGSFPIKVVPFWQASTDNLLAEDSIPTRITSEGPHTFSFSLVVPDSFAAHPNSAHKHSLKDKIGGLLKHHIDETENQSSEGASTEQHPLPPSSLPHQDVKSSANQIAAGYTISVTLQFSSKLQPDVRASHDIVVLLLKDQEVEAEDDHDQRDSEGLATQTMKGEFAQARLPDTPLHHA